MIEIRKMRMLLVASMLAICSIPAWRLPAKVMCRVQREKMPYAGQRECIL